MKNNLVVSKKQLSEMKDIFIVALNVYAKFNNPSYIHFEMVNDDDTFNINGSHFFKDWSVDVRVQEYKDDLYKIVCQFVLDGRRYFLGLISRNKSIDDLKPEDIVSYDFYRQNTKTYKEVKTTLKTIKKNIDKLAEELEKENYNNLNKKMENLVRRNVKRNKTDIIQDKKNILKYGTGKYYFLTWRNGTLCYPEWYYNSEEGQSIWNYYVSDVYDKHDSKTYELDVKFISSDNIPYGTVKPIKQKMA